MRLNFEPWYFILFVPVSGARVVGAAVSSPPGAGAPHEAQVARNQDLCQTRQNHDQGTSGNFIS